MSLQKFVKSQPASSITAWLVRWGNVLIAASLLLSIGLFAGLWFGGSPQAYRHAVGLLGFHNTFVPIPLIDTYTELSWLECSRMGIDIFHSNPCDEYSHFSMDYPPVLLLGTVTSLGTWATPWIGLAKCAVFLCAVAMMPALRSPKELLVRLALFLSPIVAYGLEHSQSELLIFSATCLGCALLPRPGWPRYLGYAAFFMAAVLKFFPAVLVVLAAREPLARCLVITGAFALAGLAALSIHADALPAMIGNLPMSLPFTGGFGMSNLAAGLANLGPSYFIAWPWLENTITLAGLTVSVVAMATILRHQPLRHAIRCITPDAALFGCAGAILTLGFFLAIVSIAYRGIELLLLVPAIYQLASVPKNRGVRMGARVTLCVMLFAFWFDPIRAALGIQSAAAITPVQFLVWTLHEMAWWWLFTGAGVIAGALALEFRTVETLRLLARRVFSLPSFHREI